MCALVWLHCKWSGRNCVNQHMVNLYSAALLVLAFTHRAPEVSLGLPISEKIDMWGLGCLLLALYLSNHPFSVDCEYQGVSIWICADVNAKTGIFCHKNMSKPNRGINVGCIFILSPDERNCRHARSATSPPPEGWNTHLQILHKGQALVQPRVVDEGN